MSLSSLVRVHVPATIGNVGPGFDVLGLAVGGLGDTVSLSLTDGPPAVGEVRGRDADLIPRDPAANCAVIAAQSFLRRVASTRSAVVSFERRLPLAGGLGSSAAASVGGALAAAVAEGCVCGPTAASASGEIRRVLLEAALDGEEAVAGRHLDNIAPCLLGGLCLAGGVSPPEATRLPILGEWWVAVVSPSLRLSTREARAVLPESVDRSLLVAQMANAVGVVAAFATGDAALMRRSLRDLFAEPRRAPLISGFERVQPAALAAGALGCSVSGAGPTVFALAADEPTARSVAGAMQSAFRPVASEAHVGRIDLVGATVLL